MKNILLFLSFYIVHSAFVDPSNGKVLVLGSGGLIGSAVVEWLEARDYEVLHVRNRRHIDLREPHALSVYDNETISFCFFLACEVGGSKFIDSAEGNVQLAIVEHNVQIYQQVFPWLDEQNVPFVFTSSYLHMLPTAYGSIKRLGENWMDALHKGKIVRLWNIYGVEHEHGLKSHVLTDWILSCLKDGEIHALTDGREARQFLYVHDTADALGSMMLHYPEVAHVNHVSSGRWTTLKTLAKLVSERSPHPCTASYSTKRANARARLSPTDWLPSHIWTPTTSLEQGIENMYQTFMERLGMIESPSPSSPSSSGSSTGFSEEKEEEVKDEIETDKLITNMDDVNQKASEDEQVESKTETNSSSKHKAASSKSKKKSSKKKKRKKRRSTKDEL